MTYYWGWSSYSWGSHNDWYSKCYYYYNPKTSIEGRIWNDKDCDGKEDRKEKGVEGVVVNLIDKKGDIVATTKTDHYGEYEFKVKEGKYKIEVENPDGYEFTEQEAKGTNIYNNSNVDKNGMSDFYWFDGGEHYSQLDAGLKKSKFEIVKDTIELDDDVDSFSFNILANDTPTAQLEVVAVNVGTGNVGELIFDFRDGAPTTQSKTVESREGVEVDLTLTIDGDLTIDTDLAFKGKVDGDADDLVSFDYRATDGNQTGNAVVAFLIDDYDVA